MRAVRGLALALSLSLSLAGCPAAKVPTSGGVAKPRPRASLAAPVRPAAIPADAVARATQGLAARVVEPAASPTRLTGKVKLLSDHGAGIISDNGGGIISNNSGAIISDNGGGIISDNGGGLVSNNGAGLTSKTKYAVRQAGAAKTAHEFALADAVVTFHDAAGNLLTTEDGGPLVAYTDREGAYTAELPLPAENVVLRVRLWNGGELQAMAPRDGGATRSQPVDTATSLGAAYVLEKFVKGDQRTFDKLPAGEALALRDAIEAARGALAGAPRYERGELLGLAETLSGQAPAVASKLKDIEALLIGQVASGDGRPADEVALPQLVAMVVDAQGRLLLGEPTLGRIRDVRPDGLIGTYADLYRGKPVRQNFTEFDDLAVGPGGSLYVTAANSVYHLAPDGAVTRVAGSGAKARASLGGPALETNLEPGAIAVMPDGTLYFADSSSAAAGAPAATPATRVVALGADGLARDVTDAVCPARPGYLDLVARPDGTLYSLTYGGLAVRRWKPGQASEVVAELPSRDSQLDARLAVGPDGTCYVSLPAEGRVVAIGPDGAQRTVAGAGGPPATADLALPSRLAMGPDGTLYVHDRASALVHGLGPDGSWRRVAGASGKVRAEGDLTAIALNRPSGVAYDAQGGLIFSESGGYAIRRFANGAIAPVAGTGAGDAGDGGAATGARLREPGSVASRDGTTWVMDAGNRRLRAIDPAGNIRTVVGGVLPYGVTVEASGLAIVLAPGERRPPEGVLLDGARGLALDAAGRPYWAMSLAGQIWRLADDGLVESVAGVGASGNLALGLDALASLSERITTQSAAEARLAMPFGLAFDSHGDLYVAETMGLRVRRLSGLAGGAPMLHPVMGMSLPEMMAFEGTVGSVEGRLASEIAAPLPLGLCVDGEDRLFVGYAGTTNMLAFSNALGVEVALPPGIPGIEPGVIRIDRDGTVHHVAGPYARYFSDPTAEDAVSAPMGLAIDAQGRLAIADFSASVLRILPVGTAQGRQP